MVVESWVREYLKVKGLGQGVPQDSALGLGSASRSRI